MTVFFDAQSCNELISKFQNSKLLNFDLLTSFLMKTLLKTPEEVCQRILQMERLFLQSQIEGFCLFAEFLINQIQIQEFSHQDVLKSFKGKSLEEFLKDPELKTRELDALFYLD